MSCVVWVVYFVFLHFFSWDRPCFCFTLFQSFVSDSSLFISCLVIFFYVKLNFLVPSSVTLSSACRLLSPPTPVNQLSCSMVPAFTLPVFIHFSLFPTFWFLFFWLIPLRPHQYPDILLFSHDFCSTLAAWVLCDFFWFIIFSLNLLDYLPSHRPAF